MQVFQATPGDVVGERFRLIERLGKTPNADTWRALDVDASDTPCVVKILGGADLTNVDQLRAFEREARVLGSLSHVGVPRVLAAVTDARGAYVLGLQQIEGLDLATHIHQGPRLGRTDLLAVARGVLGVLDYLHTRTPPIFHRDIKPSNIIRRPDGSVVLVDFGAVCDGWRAEHTIAVGTLGYMAPEQLHGQVSPRSDLYALGATLLHLATGRAPSECVERYSGALAIPGGVELEPRLRVLIEACILAAPGARPENAEAALALLERPVGVIPKAVRAPVIAPESAPEPRRVMSPVTGNPCVWNAAVLPPAPRDPRAPDLLKTFTQFADGVRYDKSKSHLFIVGGGVLGVLAAIGMLATDDSEGMGLLAVGVLALAVGISWFVSTAMGTTAAVRDEGPGGAVYKAFQEGTVRYGTVVNSASAGDPAGGCRVAFRLEDAPELAPQSIVVAFDVAFQWAPGESFPFLLGPDNVPVPIVADV